ncbi:MAG: sigma-54 interaction domain-containing protein [Bacillota bacterium]
MDRILKDENFTKLLNCINDGVQLVDKKGILVFCNKKAAMIDDIDISDSLGKHITEIYPNLDKDNSTLLKVLDKQVKIVDNHQEYLTYKGKKVITLNSTYPIIKENELIGAVEISNNITEVKKLSDQVGQLQRIVYGKDDNEDEMQYYDFNDIITQDPEMIEAKNLAKKVSKTSMNVLVYGNTGTGKELLVQAIHNNSDRKQDAFIAQNCAALPSNLLEGILFGTKKGSFTGAIDRVGIFELADGGTLFLDEINSMPIELQAKLLRVLENGVVRRIGGTKPRQVNVKVIAASNVDPLKAVENNTLRRDLFYRLNTFMIELPDLKDRPKDIELLTKYFIKKFNKEMYKNIQSISKEAKDILISHDWPGNVRELENIIKSTVSLTDQEEIGLNDLPNSIVKKNKDKSKINFSKFNLQNTLEKKEKEFIQLAYKKANKNTSKAARLLSIPRQTLQYKLKKYNIS